MAEREGFEPSRRQNRPNGLAIRPLQPLGYLSLGKTSRITPSACASGRNSFNVGFTHVSRTFLPAERRIWRNPERLMLNELWFCLRIGLSL
jgi:hypothetical protein